MGDTTSMCRYQQTVITQRVNRTAHKSNKIVEEEVKNPTVIGLKEVVDLLTTKKASQGGGLKNTPKLEFEAFIECNITNNNIEDVNTLRS
eukprot:UN17402